MYFLSFALVLIIHCLFPYWAINSMANVCKDARCTMGDKCYYYLKQGEAGCPFSSEDLLEGWGGKGWVADCFLSAVPLIPSWQNSHILKTTQNVGSVPKSKGTRLKLLALMFKGKENTWKCCSEPL